MAKALDEAKNGLGDTSPNPAVGALLVHGGRAIGRGYHRVFGGPHAEVEAIRSVRSADLAKIAASTLVVTLEPCDHFGKTPPCTGAILQAGIRRVVVGMADPHSIVAGRGIRKLRAAGVRVDVLNDPAALAFYAPYRTFLIRRRSFVTVKLAVSTDGKISGHGRRWISGPAARAEVQNLRRTVDAILIGRNTADVDNPRLTLRGRRRTARIFPPARVVLTASGTLRAPARLKLLTDGEAPTFLVTGAARSRRIKIPASDCRILPVPANAGGRLSIPDVLRVLAKQGVVHLLVEGGSQTVSSFLSAGAVDQMILFVSPAICGPTGLDAFLGRCGPARGRPADWRLIERAKIGPDFMLRFRSSQDTSCSAE